MAHHDQPTLLVSLLLASAVEAVSLAAMFSTMGHAGPAGRFALIGWLATLLNFPGLFGAAIVGVSTGEPIMKLAAIVFSFQMPFVWAVTYLVLRLLKYALRGGSNEKEKNPWIAGCIFW